MLYEPGDDLAESFVIREDDGTTTTYGSHRDLKIYQLAHQLGVEAHHLSLRLPKYELYETGSQLRRAAKSVSANIVEGFGRRRYKADFVRFLVYAKASLHETEEHLQYISDCYPEQSETVALLESAHSLGGRLYRFLAAVESSHRV